MIYGVLERSNVYLDAPKPYRFSCRNSRIDRLEDSPASPLAFQHTGFSSLSKLDKVEVVAGTHRSWHNQGFREAPLLKHPLSLLLFHIKNQL